ncbi:MAG: hypothetical protein ICV77_18025 [Cyanobacteria bacterium Co-bin8]|nr:hypothetical protein [Cyanobacteria bacterium Co-bin8]
MPTPTDGLRLHRLGPSRHLVPWLWALTLLFLLRVLGQVLVACCQMPLQRRSQCSLISALKASS